MKDLLSNLVVKSVQSICLEEVSTHTPSILSFFQQAINVEKMKYNVLSFYIRFLIWNFYSKA